MSKLYGITTYFNPCNYQSRIDNLILFYESIIDTLQGNLIIVELQLPGNLRLANYINTPNTITLNDKEVLWQKEALLNIGVDNLPDDCDNVVWLDCDILFDNNRDWVKQTNDLLTSYKMVQPFKIAAKLDEYTRDVVNIDDWPNGLSINNKIGGSVANYKNNIAKLNHPGYACAFKRDILQKHKLYTNNIIGGGDRLMMDIILYGKVNGRYGGLLTHNHRIEFYQWGMPFKSDIGDSFHYTNNTVYHLYHGERNNRRYNSRLEILRKLKYNPDEDVYVKRNGLVGLTERGKRFEQSILEYFIKRQEDK